MVYMDIDYMEDYKDFTVNQENFPDFEAYVNEMKEKGIHLVPIIDAGVKVEAGYDVYEEGVEKNYFCKREDGSDFVSAVWLCCKPNNASNAISANVLFNENIFIDVYIFSNTAKTNMPNYQ